MNLFFYLELILQWNFIWKSLYILFCDFSDCTIKQKKLLDQLSIEFQNKINLYNKSFPCRMEPATITEKAQHDPHNS